jgi:integrase
MRQHLAFVAACHSWSFVENLKRYAREAGIGKIHLHQTRHTFARMVAKRSGSLSETQDALGHRHASTTRIYVESIAVKTDKYSEPLRLATPQTSAGASDALWAASIRLMPSRRRRRCHGSACR